MGLDWGFSLRNKKTKEHLDLVSFCGWNSKELLKEVQTLGNIVKIKDANGFEYKQSIFDKTNLEGLINYGTKAYKIFDILNGVSDRKIEGETFTKKQLEKLEDLFYDLDLPFDTYIIYDLERLAIFTEFLKRGDMFKDFDTEYDDYEIYLWESF